MKKLILFVSLLISFSGCTTFFTKRFHRVKITSNVEAAEVYLLGKKQGITPIELKMKRRPKHMKSLELRKHGYHFQKFDYKGQRKIRGGYFLNIIPWNGLIGLGWDAATGAAWKIDGEQHIVMVAIDNDGDGVPYLEDLCHDSKGLKEFRGCPDTDQDSVPDYLDDCPQLSGFILAGGCPDDDGDGIKNSLDKCPEYFGNPVNEFGCEDADEDGGYADVDDDDFEAGPKKCGYVPCPDQDGDGVFDFEDACIDQYGLKEFSGCPKVTNKRAKMFKNVMQYDPITFDAGDSTLKLFHQQILDGFISDFKGDEFRYSYLLVKGYANAADGLGNPTAANALAKARAKEVTNYIVDKGISKSRIYPIEFEYTLDEDTRGKKVELIQVYKL